MPAQTKMSNQDITKKQCQDVKKKQCQDVTKKQSQDIKTKQGHVTGTQPEVKEKRLSVTENRPAVIALFQAAVRSLKEGRPVFCPHPRALSDHHLSQRTESGSWRVCKETQFKKPRYFYLHAARRHNIAYSALMTGAKKCFLSNPTTGVICGMKFDRDDHLLRHQRGGDCLAQRGKFATPRHLKGCTFVFDDKRVCGKSFKQLKDYKRHMLSKSHGGPGARGQSGGVAQVSSWHCLSQYIFSKYHFNIYIHFFQAAVSTVPVLVGPSQEFPHTETVDDILARYALLLQN